MIQMRSCLGVVDNTGVRMVRVICVHKDKRAGGMGDMVTASVREADPGAKARKGDVVRALVVRTRKPHHRPDGRLFGFAENSAVLLAPDGKPLGTRVFGPVPVELRAERWLKVLSLAPMSL